MAMNADLTPTVAFVPRVENPNVLRFPKMAILVFLFVQTMRFAPLLMAVVYHQFVQKYCDVLAYCGSFICAMFSKYGKRRS